MHDDAALLTSLTDWLRAIIAFGILNEEPVAMSQMSRNEFSIPKTRPISRA
jgi:hypothetical protein